MAEFVGGESVTVGVDEPITFENKTDTAFDVGYGIVFRKSGLYRVSIVGRHTSVAVEPARKKGEWIDDTFCSECGWVHEVESGFIGSVEQFSFCPNCGAYMRGEQDETD